MRNQILKYMFMCILLIAELTMRKTCPGPTSYPGYLGYEASHNTGGSTDINIAQIKHLST